MQVFYFKNNKVKMVQVYFLFINVTIDQNIKKQNKMLIFFVHLETSKNLELSFPYIFHSILGIQGIQE